VQLGVAAISVRRVLLGAFVAGTVMNVLDAVTNGLLVRSELAANSVRLGLDPAAAETPAGLVILAGLDYVLGAALVYVYAAMRPRFGPGPATALRGAAALYVATMVIVVGFALMGVVTASMLWKMSLAGVVTMAAGGLAGAAVYKE
jgi:hypothetical protein